MIDVKKSPPPNVMHIRPAPAKARRPHTDSVDSTCSFFLARMPNKAKKIPIAAELIPSNIAVAE